MLDESKFIGVELYLFSLINIHLQLLEDFIDEFFDQNPISQLGIIVTRNKRAEKLSELAGNPKKHIKVYRNLLKSDFMGASHYRKHYIFIYIIKFID